MYDQSHYEIKLASDARKLQILKLILLKNNINNLILKIIYEPG